MKLDHPPFIFVRRSFSVIRRSTFALALFTSSVVAQTSISPGSFPGHSTAAQPSGAGGPVTFHAQPQPSSDPSYTPQIQPGAEAVPFHNQQPGMNPTGGTDPVTSVDAAGMDEPQQEMDSLAEQKQTLESDLRYAKVKLDDARKRLDVESMAGNAEQADKLQQEVKDWDTRVRSLQSQVSDVNSEVQGAIQQIQPSPEQSIILPGDNIEIFVNEDASFNGRYQVRRGGYIIIPSVGRIFVAGKTYEGAESAISKALETNQLQHATVMVEKVEGSDIESGPVIYLAGEFKAPRPFIIPTGTKATVISVILSSGGVTDKADLTRVRVMRVVANKSVVEEENVQRILDGSGLASDLTLNSGDVVTIPAGSANVIYVTGSVARPGDQPLRPGDKITAYAAILQAGGFARFADRRHVYILRAMPDGTKARIRIDIVAIERGREADVPLEGNDILVIPEKFWSF